MITNKMGMNSTVTIKVQNALGDDITDLSEEIASKKKKKNKKIISNENKEGKK